MYLLDHSASGMHPPSGGTLPQTWHHDEVRSCTRGSHPEVYLPAAYDRLQQDSRKDSGYIHTAGERRKRRNPMRHVRTDSRQDPFRKTKGCTEATWHTLEQQVRLNRLS